MIENVGKVFIDTFLKCVQVIPDKKMIFKDTGQERYINMFYYDEDMIRQKKLMTIIDEGKQTIKTLFDINNILFDFDSDSKMIHVQRGFLQKICATKNLTWGDLGKIEKVLNGTELEGYSIKFGVLINPRLLYDTVKWEVIKDKDFDYQFSYKYEWVYDQDMANAAKTGNLYKRGIVNYTWEKR